MKTKLQAVLCAFTTALLLAVTTAQAATFLITSRDPAGVGFNDPTPVAPVGGNPGTTLGAQRFNVYQYVAGIWGANLASNVVITVSAAWEALSCTATTATLGSASAWNIWRDFPGGVPGTWYPQALANKLSDMNLSAGVPDDGSGFGNVDIKTQFNINLGQPNCLAGMSFYLGLDGNAGSQINFVETLLHELGHGLGFSVLTVQTSTGNRLNADGTAFVANGGLPSIWEGFMFDNTAGKTWLAMSSPERRASAINPLQLAWTGSNTVTGAAAVLSHLPVLAVSGVAAGPAAGEYAAGTASFGPTPGPPVVTRDIMPVTEQGAGTGAGCTAFNAANTAAVNNKIALIDRGVCTFVIKAKNAQNAGAVGVVIVNNAAGPAPGLGGSDPTITIPTVSISQADGVTLKARLAFRSRTASGVVGTIGTFSATLIAGADTSGRPLLYTPNPLVAGSSVSHWDTSAFPNLLMEPAINADLTTILVPPKDLTVPLLVDLGWTTLAP